LAAQFKAPIATVIGFPHGANTPDIKRAEMQKAIRDGATEVDIVMNYSRFIEGYPRYAEDELRYVLDRLPLRVTAKIILETCYLTQDQVVSACQLIQRIPNIAFVKTSTGFGTAGATVEAVEAMKRGIEGSSLKIKASGGINTYKDVETFLDLGCERLGSSKWEQLLCS
jgi:deoxyribose-phosphate aldolase